MQRLLRIPRVCIALCGISFARETVGKSVVPQDVADSPLLVCCRCQKQLPSSPRCWQVFVTRLLWQTTRFLTALWCSPAKGTLELALTELSSALTVLFCCATVATPMRSVYLPALGTVYTLDVLELACTAGHQRPLRLIAGSCR